MAHKGGSYKDVKNPQQAFPDSKNPPKAVGKTSDGLVRGKGSGGSSKSSNSGRSKAPKY